MSKVKVSKEVAEVLNKIKEFSPCDLDMGFRKLGNILYNQTCDTDTMTYKILTSHGMDWELFNALQYGYEVKRAPEEEILDRYKSYIKMHYFDQNSKGYREGALHGIRTTLNSLGVIIDGVNGAHDAPIEE